MRNISVELYRILLMFGICLLHSISFGLFKCTWASNILRHVLPKTAGLDTHGGLTLIVVYAAARVLRGFKADGKIGTWWVVASIPILGILTGIGLGDYNSPFAFALAVCVFAIGCALDLPRRLIVHLCGNCLRSFALRSG